MTRLQEKNFTYDFPPGWAAEKWDDTEFHRKRFSNSMGSSKSVDLVAFDNGADHLWLIECKDFRLADNLTILRRCEEIPQKFKDTLASLVCARNAPDEPTKSFSRSALKKTRLRCVVHWEFDFHHDRRLFPVKTMVADIQTKLKQQLQVADPSSLIGNQRQISAVVPLTIQEIP